MKIAELRAKNKDELKELVLTLKKEQFNLRMQDSTGQLENRSRFKEARRTIARAKTLLNAKPGDAPVAAKPKKEAAPKKAKAAAKKTKKKEE